MNERLSNDKLVFDLSLLFFEITLPDTSLNGVTYLFYIFYEL